MASDVRLAAVPARDGADDGQPEPGAAPAARVVGAREAVEGAGGEARREAGPVVTHVELDPVDAGLCGHRDRAASVADRVVHEVAERLLEATWIGAHDELLGRGDRDARGGPGLLVAAPAH